MIKYSEKLRIPSTDSVLSFEIRHCFGFRASYFELDKKLFGPT